MEIEEAGPDPVDLAMAIHAQLGPGLGSVPVEAIAAALDIVEIRIAPLSSIAGALLMPADRNCGSILVERNANDRRRRFTIAHELGHYLSLHHRPFGPNGQFLCTSQDLAFQGSTARERTQRQHWRQEVEANRFAITLLAPAHLVQPFVEAPHGLQHVLDLAGAIDLSREAAARRYAECHPMPLALVFAQDGVIRYCVSHPAFPRLDLAKGRRLRDVSPPAEGSTLSLARQVDPRAFGLLNPRAAPLFAQTLHQMSGFSITLLTSDPRILDTTVSVAGGGSA